MSCVLSSGLTVCLPSSSKGIFWSKEWFGYCSSHRKRRGLLWRGRSEGHCSAAADYTSLGMAAGVRGETCSWAEAKPNTDLGHTVVQTQHATVVGMLLSQRKMLGRLTNIPEAASQEKVIINLPVNTFHLLSSAVVL